MCHRCDHHGTRIRTGSISSRLQSRGGGRRRRRQEEKEEEGGGEGGRKRREEEEHGQWNELKRSAPNYTFFTITIPFHSSSPSSSTTTTTHPIRCFTIPRLNHHPIGHCRFSHHNVMADNILQLLLEEGQPGSPSRSDRSPPFSEI